MDTPIAPVLARRHRRLVLGRDDFRTASASGTDPCRSAESHAQRQPHTEAQGLPRLSRVEELIRIAFARRNSRRRTGDCNTAAGNGADPVNSDSAAPATGTDLVVLSPVSSRMSARIRDLSLPVPISPCS
ncbi:hypothetical protein GCM10010260_82480 [Streptomyces filipinensis]|uniref:Uncharacterized protein n=1 Tax=Streptomyces filipinensis TaxID=66887 RepID=A0A918IJY9_9ACTN|nr:hypothetical protein GCM10010260_82480 [Streptomyces filipinensis]